MSELHVNNDNQMMEEVKKPIFRGKTIEKITKKILCDILHIELTDDRLEALMQFIKFGIVGLSNTVISYLIYLGALVVFDWFGVFREYDYLAAVAAGFILSILWSFFWNRSFVFHLEGNRKTLLLALLKTYICYSFTGLFLNSVLSVFWVEKVGISKTIAPALNLLISVPLNFMLNKFWAFRKKE